MDPQGFFTYADARRRRDTRHVRHDPPWIAHPWVTTPDGRQNRLGAVLDCQQCEVSEGNPRC